MTPGIWGLLLLGVSTLEACDTASRVQDLLLPGVERVALGANIRAKGSLSGSTPGGKAVSAGAMHLGFYVVGVDTLFHDGLLKFDFARVAVVTGTQTNHGRGNRRNAILCLVWLPEPNEATLPFLSRSGLEDAKQEFVIVLRLTHSG